MAWVPLVLALASGWMLAIWIGPARGLEPPWAAGLLHASLGAGLGMGISSVSYFLMLLAGIASPGSVLAFHAVFAAGSGVLAWRKRRDMAERPTTPRLRVGRTTWVLALLVVAVLIPVLVAEVRISNAIPHGQWDAWAIWNLRAKFLAGDGDTWRQALSPLLNRTHPEYPLLLPGVVAVNWRAAGGAMDPAIPKTVTFLFPLAAAGVLLAGLTMLRHVNLGLLALLVLISDQAFLIHASGQMSDVPLGFYYVAAIVCFLLSLEKHARARPTLALAGVLASLAAWTKDEGIAFLVVFFGCAAAFEIWNGRLPALWRRFSWMVAGALPVALLAGVFKLFLIPHASASAPAGVARAAAPLLTSRRITNLFLGIWAHFGDRGDGLLHSALVLTVAVAALGVGVAAHHRRRAVFLGVLLTGLFAVYCAAILANRGMLGGRWVMPMDRMYSQLWPSVVFLAFFVVRSWETPAPAPATAAEPPVEGKKKRRASRR